MDDFDIFHNAPENATPDELAAYLDEACGGDAELRTKVEELLANQSRTDDFLEEAPLDFDAPTIGPDGQSSGKESPTPTGDASPRQVATEQAGDAIGPFTLIEKLGEGGFGTVWKAEQSVPIARTVALKIIKLGMDTREVLTRFEAERQALAMMNHENIAKVLDAGATENGRPYFVMELVDGVPITKYCDEQQLDTRQRLELFRDVCAAVNHAHQKGMIHRDIKPSNVMVTTQDDMPVIKVIDFGIAKATEGKLSEETLVTLQEQIIGTPAYMSPEQAGMDGLDIDTRSDIYSLGVLLYELLSGKPPFDPKTLMAAGFDEMRRIVREEEPPRPSHRVSTVSRRGEAVKFTTTHGTEQQKLSRILRGDLDWIVMKALEKDRGRRYETANAFSSDLERFLADKPVSAVPPSFAYLFWKFARRNKMAITILFVLAGFSAVLLQQSIELRRQSQAFLYSIESTATFDVQKVLNEIDRLIQNRVADWQAYCQGELVKETLKDSNAQFADLPDIEAHIMARDQEWLAADSPSSHQLLTQLTGNRLAHELRARMRILEEISGYPVLGEVFLTNAHGANVAQTRRTSDYRQDDEEWWQVSAKNGIFVGDVEFDDSAEIYSIAVCLRIDDAKGEFLGVLKAVMNIREVFAIVDSHASLSHEAVQLALLTSDRQIVRVGNEETAPLVGGSYFLSDQMLATLESFRPDLAAVTSATATEPNTGNEIAYTAALGSPGGATRKFGWILVARQQDSVVLQPISATRSRILVITLGFGLICVLLLLTAFVTTRLSRRIANLAIRISRKRIPK